MKIKLYNGRKLVYTLITDSSNRGWQQLEKWGWHHVDDERNYNPENSCDAYDPNKTYARWKLAPD